ncbi:hypothetical protein D3C76_1684450 [compost metagenome]
MRQRGVFHAGDFAVIDQITEIGDHNLIAAEARAFFKCNARTDREPNPGKSGDPLGKRHQQRQRQENDEQK